MHPHVLKSDGGCHLILSNTSVQHCSVQKTLTNDLKNPIFRESLCDISLKISQKLEKLRSKRAEFWLDRSEVPSVDGEKYTWYIVIFEELNHMLFKYSLIFLDTNAVPSTYESFLVFHMS